MVCQLENREPRTWSHERVSCSPRLRVAEALCKETSLTPSDPQSAPTPIPENVAQGSESVSAPVGRTTILTPLGEGKIAEKLAAMSQRGKLPGFEARSGGFLALAYGWVYDFDLVAKFGAVEGVGGTRIGFELLVKKKMPWIVAALLVVSVWPGVWITDSMLSIYFDWYPKEFWKTCVWYLPLAIIPIPWVWKTAMNRSRAEAEVSARELIERVATELGGSIVEASA